MPTDAIVLLDAAATILRWLIGDDNHVPVRTESPGELAGGSATSSAHPRR